MGVVVTVVSVVVVGQAPEPVGAAKKEQVVVEGEIRVLVVGVVVVVVGPAEATRASKSARAIETMMARVSTASSPCDAFLPHARPRRVKNERWRAAHPLGCRSSRDARRKQAVDQRLALLAALAPVRRRAPAGAGWPVAWPLAA